MKISINWLKKYLKLDQKPAYIAEILTNSGLEVEGISHFNFFDKGLVIGEVMDCSRHPNAEKLFVTKVDIGTGELLNIVCGASNIEKGQKVVVSPIGTTLRTYQGDEFKIKKTKIRGEVSEGMICAEDEIDLGSLHECTIALDTDLKPGTPISIYYDTPEDNILEVGLTPNRSDAASHIGVARELSALLETPLLWPTFPEVEKNIKKDLPFRITLEDHASCPRYAGIVLKNITIKTSPLWLRNRLKSIGIACINNVVDITNYVLHELGQPMHAYDYDKVKNQQLTIRRAKGKEQIITLDGKKRELNTDDLVIADDHEPLCMAGIMGSKAAEVDFTTKTIFLESAYFAPKVISKMVKKHVISTDASFRFERGTDPDIVIKALLRAISLLKKEADAVEASSLFDFYPKPIFHVKVPVKYANINRLVGKEIAKTTVKKILNNLSIELTEETSKGFTAIVPPYRVDVLREADIVEELVRMIGYDNLASKSTSTDLKRYAKKIHQGHAMQGIVASMLAAQGFFEMITNSLCSLEDNLFIGVEKSSIVTLQNPLSEQLNALRGNALVSALPVIANNIKRGHRNLKLYEFGKTYHQDAKDNKFKYIENEYLGIWLSGKKNADNWRKDKGLLDIYDAHLVVDKVIQRLGIDNFKIEEKQANNHKKLIWKCKGKQLAELYMIPLDVLKYFTVDQPVFFSLLNWELLMDLRKKTIQYMPISKYPAVKRDLSLILSREISFEKIRQLILSQHENIITEVHLVDTYEGKPLEKNQKTYTLTFVLQSIYKTLKEKEINKLMEKLISVFEEDLNAIIKRE